MRGRTTFYFAAILCFVFVLTACSSGKVEWDPAAVEAELTTEPSTVKAGEEITLVAKLTGIPENQTGSDMQFDVPMDGKSNLVGGEDTGKGVYTLLFTFPRAGTYDIYIHYYQDGEHITKLKKLEVL